jgi:hypothetical protein
MVLRAEPVWFFGAALVLVTGTPTNARSASPPSPKPDADALYEKGHRALAAPRAAYGRALAKSLDSSNPYERRLALEALAASPVLVSRQVLPALVRRLEETEKLPSELCADLLHRLGQNYGGQGEEIDYARCRHEGGVSNGSLAAKLLLPRSGYSLIVAHLVRRPEVVDAVLASLGDMAGGGASEILKALSSTPNPGAQAALLRLALVDRCGSVTLLTGLAPVIALQESAEPRVKVLAALALLRLSGCSGEQPSLVPARQRAIAVIESRLKDQTNQDVVKETAQLGLAGAPLVRALLYRLERVAPKSSNPERLAIIEALGAIGPGAQAAIPELLRILREPNALSLRKPTLLALASIGSAAASAKADILPLASNDLWIVPAVQALAAIRAPIDRNEFARLYSAYQKRCKDAESIPMFNLQRDDDCHAEAEALSLIAESNGHSFKTVGWQQ